MDVNHANWRDVRKAKRREISKRNEYNRAINDIIARSEKRAIDLGGAEFLPLAALDALTLAEEVLRLRDELNQKIEMHNQTIAAIPRWIRHDWSGRNF